MAEPEVAAPPDVVELPASRDIPHERRIFVNRSLRMEPIQLVGFDMDYTLATYRQEAIHALSVELTCDKLIAKKGYPREIARLTYDPAFAIRGLCVDAKLGHIFKQDRYGHVGRVYHGRRLLPADERHALYHATVLRPRAPRYAWIDHLFALPEATMYAELIEFFDGQPIDLTKLWTDIRECIDEAHRDETLKSRIKAHLGDYIVFDPELPPTLHKLRSSGKRLFLLTNSWWNYTDHVMRYLLDDKLPAYPSWRSYFDLICVASDKPRFFTEARPFLELDPATGEPIGEARTLQRGRVYHGGSISAFEPLTGVPADHVLYVGDHIYGDMLRSKKSTAWRTAMILQELDGELKLLLSQREAIERLSHLDKMRRRRDADVGFWQQRLRALQRQAEQAPSLEVEAAKRATKAELDRVRAELRQLDGEYDALDGEIDRSYNPYWGPSFKEGNENSKFGEQVEDYACVYTSRVSNFLAYSPVYYFRAPRDFMPHEVF